MTRAYRLKRRAETQDETRRRIVDAAIELHESVGDAATTISAIAERAGVGRVTVYRHFPDERALLSACTGHYFAAHPPPDSSTWSMIGDSRVRLRIALETLYGYYESTEGMLARAEQDAPSNPVLAELLTPFDAYRVGIRDLLAEGWSSEFPKVLRAAIGHALAFGTWRSLLREQGLNQAQAVDLMVELVRCTASTSRQSTGGRSSSKSRTSKMA